MGVDGPEHLGIAAPPPRMTLSKPRKAREAHICAPQRVPDCSEWRNSAIDSRMRALKRSTKKLPAGSPLRTPARLCLDRRCTSSRWPGLAAVPHGEINQVIGGGGGPYQCCRRLVSADVAGPGDVAAGRLWDRPSAERCGASAVWCCSSALAAAAASARLLRPRRLMAFPSPDTALTAPRRSSPAHRDVGSHVIDLLQI